MAVLEGANSRPSASAVTQLPDGSKYGKIGKGKIVIEDADRRDVNIACQNWRRSNAFRGARINLSGRSGSFHGKISFP
jgi:hypothetical protein